MTTFEMNYAPVVDLLKKHLEEMKPYLYVDSVYKPPKILETTIEVIFLCIISRRGDDVAVFYQLTMPLDSLDPINIKIKRLDD